MPITPATPKKKRLLMALAIFGLPVLILVFVIIALCRPASPPKPTPITNKGFNARMPEPNLHDGQKNKLELYMEAQQDSLRRKAAREKDSYGQETAPATPVPSYPPTSATSGALHLSAKPPSPFQSLDTNERKVNDRLQKLYEVLQSSGTASPRAETMPGPVTAPPGEPMPAARWAQLMSSLQQKDTGVDPQMVQINQALDKLVRLQHPEKAAPETTAAGGGVPIRTSLPVSVESTAGPAAPFETTSLTEENTNNGFYGLADETDSAVIPSKTIAAEVHADQMVVTGATVKLRLLQDIFIGATRIPANSFIYGPCSIAGERVQIQLTNVVTNGQLYPISLKVYDAVDGLEGLYVPGAITRDVIKEGVGQGVSGMGVTTLDQSVGAQAAAAGIETVRTLLSRKIRLVQVTLKAGHRALLKNPEGLH